MEYTEILRAMEVIITSFIYVYPDDSTLQELILLGERKREILRIEEVSWKLKSRVLWLAEGDLNTKYFHKMANGRKSRNSIWGIRRGDGTMAYTSQEIREEATQYFSLFFSRQAGIDNDCQEWLLEHVNRFMNEEAISIMEGEVTENEIIRVLKAFSAAKSPGPDGWPAEFFTHFFELLGKELTQIIELIRTTGYMPTSLNSTFIVLIPKVNDPQSFTDFRPISLCNVLYKIVSKIIADRLKGILSVNISK